MLYNDFIVLLKLAKLFSLWSRSISLNLYRWTIQIFCNNQKWVSQSCWAKPLCIRRSMKLFGNSRREFMMWIRVVPLPALFDDICQCQVDCEALRLLIDADHFLLFRLEPWTSMRFLGDRNILVFVGLHSEELPSVVDSLINSSRFFFSALIDF